MRISGLRAIARERGRRLRDLVGDAAAAAYRGAGARLPVPSVPAFAWPAADPAPATLTAVDGAAGSRLGLVVDAGDLSPGELRALTGASFKPVDGPAPLSPPLQWARSLHGAGHDVRILPAGDRTTVGGQDALAVLAGSPAAHVAEALAAGSGLPLFVLPVPDIGSVVDTRAFAPRPAPPKLRRWLPAAPGTPLVGLNVGPADFSEEALHALIVAWDEVCAAMGTEQAVPLATASAQDVRRLRRAAGDLASRTGLAFVPRPEDALRPPLFNAFSAVVEAPRHVDDPPSQWIREAMASGLPVLRSTGVGPRSVALGLGDMARRQRLEIAASGTDALLAGIDVPGAATSPGDAPAAAAEPRVAGALGLVERRRIVVAGHDLKFARGLVAHLEASGHEVRLDEWSGHQRHDAERSGALARWADAVFCEWTLGNAVWYSRHAGPGTRVTTRLHLQEAALPFPGRVREEGMDAFVFVADHVRRQVVADHGIDFRRTVVIPNAVGIPSAPPRPDPATRHRLGLVGMVPARKGLHRALDVLALLRAEDRRFTLDLKGHLPTDHAWMEGRGSEAVYFREQFRRIEEDPLLAGAVAFSGYAPDMASWWQGVGVALSTSDFESFHFTLPDGAVHGALPVSLAWAGADQLYPLDWLHADAASMAARIGALADDAGRWAEEVASAAALVEARYGAEVVLPRLEALILGLPGS
ncbi:hypothetical protein ACQ7DA_07835 [Zafaria sp. J156]|uniref:hypothetical protein n=1 Tax=Zafaria sp. J156 TaxID=3116490 RepID=UPI002E79C336|nr:hypothetical protein [Zafaria sp. J156]MEE1620718.1 hypothetical protein [Zafaria sp. J156]